jgi:predicted ATP-grasp superfamily ATP-dependent carboligase
VKNILLLDGGGIQAISAARSLKECGYCVSAFIESKISPGYASRYIDKKILCPSLHSQKENYLVFLFQFIQDNFQDVIIPLGNNSAELLSEQKGKIELKYNTKCACPTYKVFMQAHNKASLMLLCEQENIPHPKTLELSIDNLNEVANNIIFPALIKPNISVGARGITKVNSSKELKNKFLDIEQKFGKCTLQEFINHSGVYYNVMIYRDSKGIIRGHTIIKIMRYFPVGGGTSCYCETIECPELIEISTRTLEKLNWVGFADFDVMQEQATSEFKIIEINPRIPASIHAAFISGINFPAIIVADELNLFIPKYSYKSGKSLRYMGLDVMWFLKSKNRFKFKPSWFKFFGKNIFYQDGSWRDPYPMLFVFLEGIKKYINPEFRKSKAGMRQ